MGMAAYANLSRRSSELWPDFARQLEELTGISVDYRADGGYSVALSEAELHKRRDFVARLNAQPGMIPLPTEFLTAQQLRAVNPDLGPDVVGGSHCPLDGSVDVLALFHALHRAFVLGGGAYHPLHPVEGFSSDGKSFTVQTPSRSFSADRLVLAAGLGTQRLAALAGIDPGIRPDPGTILVTERARPFITGTMGSIRQTPQGTVLIGGSPKRAGDSVATPLEDVAGMARRALRFFPVLDRLRIVRSWTGLRIMTRDGFPVYEQSRDMPGVFVCTCHSGVTLAAMHALDLAPRIAAGGLDGFEPFSTRRFDVHQAA
jgi:glycine/D-amino acid oxidase-like deaminating enzyme